MTASRADDRPVLTLADLEAHDPLAPPGGRYRRFWCPLPACSDKSLTREHRTLAVEVATGGWRCWRCGASGTLREHWQPRVSPQRQALVRLRAKLRPRPAPEPKPIARQQLGIVGDLAGTCGADYLERRGIPLAVAVAAGVRYSPAFCGRLAVLFPLRRRDGKPVAVNGRYIDSGTPKTRTLGTKAGAVFATPGAFDGPVIVTEAPLDALSFAAAEFPAIALCGTTGPDWLRVACGLRDVALALDADEAGDLAAEKLGAELASLGARVQRWRPPRKDWNDVLQGLGAEGFLEAMARCSIHARG